MIYHDIDTDSKEFHRWIILRSLHAAYPNAYAENALLSALIAIPIRISAINLRKELGYLEGKGLIEISKKDNPPWFAKILATGIDVVEYNADAPAGIARVPKYHGLTGGA